jgi:hypothetical protein
MDAYAGSIFDPVSLHKYLYANANPVMNRDPSGCKTLGELAATITIIDILAAATLGTVVILAILSNIQHNGNTQISVSGIVDDMLDGGIWGDISINIINAIQEAILEGIDDQVINWVDEDGADTETNTDTDSDSDTSTDNNEGPEDKKPDKPGKMQKEVERNQAPRDVDRVDPAHDPNNPNQQPHVHLKDKTSINMDGTPHHGTPNPSSKVIEWILSHGWSV